MKSSGTLNSRAFRHMVKSSNVQMLRELGWNLEDHVAEIQPHLHSLIYIKHAAVRVASILIPSLPGLYQFPKRAMWVAPGIGLQNQSTTAS